MEWQPIETAPRMNCSSGDYAQKKVVGLQYFNGEWEVRTTWYVDSRDFQNFTGWMTDKGSWSPTLFIPLPEPPKETK